MGVVNGAVVIEDVVIMWVWSLRVWSVGVGNGVGVVITVWSMEV